MTLPDTVNATFTVRSYRGDFRSALPVKGPPREDVRQGRRNAYTVGTGSAQVEMESFGGDISLPLARKLAQAFLALDPANPAHKEVMELQRASKFVATRSSNYDGIEAAGKSAGRSRT